MKKIIVCLLCLFLIGSAISCTTPNTPSTDETKAEQTSASDGTSASTGEESQDPYVDEIGEDVRFEGTDIRVIAASQSSNSIILAPEADTAELVNSAVYNRNLAVEDRLGVSLILVDAISWDDGLYDIIYESLNANSDDYDLIVGYGVVNIGLAAENMMANLLEVEHLDLTKAYWNEKFSTNASYGDRVYWATGDISYNYLTSLYGCYVSKQVWADSVANEESRSLYQVIEDGDWTYEALLGYSQLAERDMDGDLTINHEKDQVGLIGSPSHICNSLYFAMGGTYSQRDESGALSFSLESEKTMDLYAKLYGLFTAPKGVYNCGDGSIWNDFAAINSFTQNRALFYIKQLEVVMMDVFRNMKPDDAFSVVVLPKNDEKQTEYHTLTFNGHPIVGIPYTVPAERLSAVGATMELMASEGYQTVYPAFYETAMKTRYSRDEESAKMIDMLRDSATSDFAYIWSQRITGSGGVEMLLSNSINSGKAELSSTVASHIGAYNESLSSLLERLSALQETEK